MGKLSDAKTLGGIGSILVLLGFAPYAGIFLFIVGWILVLVAVKYISDTMGDRTIFNNAIIAVVLVMVGLVVGSVFVFTALASILGFGFFGPGFGGPGFGATMFDPATLTPSEILNLLVLVLIGFVIIWVFYLVGAIFLRRTYESIKTKLGVGMFGTAGLLYLIGAGTIIVFVGFIILFIAEILQIVAFFQLPDQPPSAQVIPPPPGIPPPPP